MGKNNISYITEYNKNTYKMYQFRVHKDSNDIISFLDGISKRNSYILSLIEKDINQNVLTLKQIKNIIKPILSKYGINEVYLFGSYSRGEAKESSDVDIYCEKGTIKTFIDLGKLEEELETSLNKKVDIIFIGSKMNDYFKNQIMEDLIKLC